jgi:Cytochrome P460
MSDRKDSTTLPAGARRMRFARAALVMLAMSMSAVAVWSVARGQTPMGPEYTPDGRLKFPIGFEKWIFVGSNIGLEYKEGPQRGMESFHNVYINPEAYQYYLANNKKFPDKTILVMDIYEPSTRDPMLAQGKFNGQRRGVEAAVKNSARPGDAPTDWAYYGFAIKPNGGIPDPAEKDGQVCYDCHRKANPQTDNVWVKFYPVLRDKQPQ